MTDQARNMYSPHSYMGPQRGILLLIFGLLASPDSWLRSTEIPRLVESMKASSWQWQKREVVLEASPDPKGPGLTYRLRMTGKPYNPEALRESTRSPPVDSKKLEHGCRMIHAGFPSLFALGLEDGRVPTFWLLL